MAEAKPTAATLLTDLLGKMGVKADVTASADTPPVLEIKTDEPGTLIGHRGEGIQALQHVLRVLLHRTGQDASVVVDVDGYRSRHHEQLKEQAREKAKEVSETGQPATLPPMSSYERRLVHVELAEADGVTTESLGEGANRRVVIKQQE
jgi:spoIIIJ-associated protein